VLLEGERIAFGASGRSGGCCAASLTHGISNGLARWPGEMGTLERMARDRRSHRVGGAGRGCARSTGSGSGSTPERIDCRPNER
jgi:hypothetical protein